MFAHLVGGGQAAGVRHGAALAAGVVLRAVEVHVLRPVSVGDPSAAAELQHSPPGRLGIPDPHAEGPGAAQGELPLYRQGSGSNLGAHASQLLSLKEVSQFRIYLIIT